MKRVLIFSLAYYPHVGGAEVALREITDRIPNSEFHLVTLNFGGEANEEKIGNVFVHRVGSSSAYFQKVLFIPRAAFAARDLHRTQHFDAFWAMMSYMTLPIVLLRWQGIRVPYLLTLQEGDSWEHMFSRWFILPFRPLLSIGFKNAATVQAVSTHLAGWAQKMGYQGGTAIIPNGVNFELFSKPIDAESRTLLRASMMKSNGALLITTSRLVKKNGIDSVIRALALLPTSVKFLIIGTGPDADELMKLTHEIGVETRVEFLGHIKHVSLPFYLQSSDIFIRPSRSEGLGLSFIEAMAAGLPVIATQEGGNADFLFDTKRNPEKETTGWAVDRDSPEQIAEAVKDILARPEQAARVTATAQKLVSENYDWHIIAPKIQSLFQQIVRPREPLTVLSFNLDTRILDPQSVIAERERAFTNYVQKYTLLIPYAHDTEVRLTESSTAYGIGGGTKFIQLIRMYLKARSLVTQSPYEVLTVQDTYYVALVGWLIARKYNLGFEIQVHGLEKFSGTRALLAKRIIPKADAIRTVSSRLKNLLITEFKIPEEKITVAPVFSEIKPISSFSSHDQLVSRIISQKKNDFIFLTIARLVPVKNIMLQLTAFKNLVTQYPDTQLWVVGDGPERTLLEKKARDFALSDRVIFWGWQSDCSVFYAHADSYLLSSDSEGWGLVIFEAATYGLAILMTDVGCAGECIHNGENGLVVPVRDLKAFETGMMKLRMNGALRESLGRAAKDSLRALPSKEELMQKYVSSWEKASLPRVST